MHWIRRGMAVLLALGLACSGLALADLQYGDAGDEVYALQETLLETGWLFEEPDGQFGRKTEKAVMEYERYKGVEVDGVADEAVCRQLIEDWKALWPGYEYDKMLGFYEEEENEAGVNCCTRERLSDGSALMVPCAAHRDMSFRTEALLNGASDGSGAASACALWRDEVLRLYDQLIEAIGEEKRGEMMNARAMFLAFYATHEAAVRSYYEHQPSSASEEAAYALLTPLQEQASWLCGLLGDTQAEIIYME